MSPALTLALLLRRRYDAAPGVADYAAWLRAYGRLSLDERREFWAAKRAVQPVNTAAPAPQKDV